jgi:hypothetical protein
MIFFRTLLVHNDHDATSVEAGGRSGGDQYRWSSCGSAARPTAVASRSKPTTLATSATTVHLESARRLPSRACGHVRPRRYHAHQILMTAIRRFGDVHNNVASAVRF